MVVTSRKAPDLEATAAAIGAFGGKALPLPAHLGKMEEIQRMVNTVMEKFGRIDILVNNAGASPAMGTVLDSDERLWDTIMNLNLKGVYFIEPGRGQDHEAPGRREDHQRRLHRRLQPRALRQRLFHLQGRRAG